MKPEELSPTFCKNLRALRLAKKMSIRGLAEALEMTPTTIVQWEKGRISPTLTSIAKLSTVFGIQPLALLGDSTTDILSAVAG